MKDIKIYLTVSRDGYISLWDKPGARFHGTRVNLALTSEQTATLSRAMRRTKQEIGDGVHMGPYWEVL